METRISDISALIYAGIDEVFNAAAKMPRRKYYVNLVRVKPNQKKYGWYDTVGDLSAAEVHSEGAPINFDKIEYNNRTTITTQVISKGVQGTLESMEFDLENVVKKQFGTPLVKVMNNKKERIVADVYNHVFVTTGADAVYEAYAAHPLKNSSSTNNNLASGELGTTTFADAKNLFNHIMDQAGEPFDTEPTHLLIHPDKIYLALQLINSNLMAFELSNNKNVMQDVFPVKVLQDRYLDYNSTTKVSPWFLLDKSLDAGCVLQTKGGLVLKTFWDLNTLSYKGLAYEMYGAGMVAPGYGFVASPGS